MRQTGSFSDVSVELSVKEHINKRDWQPSKYGRDVAFIPEIAKLAPSD